MISKLNKSPFLALFLFVSCAPTHQFYLRYGDQLSRSGLAQVLLQNPLAPGENIKVVTLGQGSTVSHHIVQIRDREPPHIHKDHDLTVVVLRGKGPIVIDKEQRLLDVGDVIFIPRGTVHHFTNNAGEPAVALVVFSPPFDGKDTLPVETR